MMRARGFERGVTLVEVLIGSAISLAVVAVACRLAVDAQAAWRFASARVDVQQRARAAADFLSRRLRQAGSGPLSGPARMELMRGVPPVLPRRAGRRAADAPSVFRADAFTVLGAVADSEHGILLTPLPAGATLLELAPTTGCQLPACGFEDGDSLVLADGTGQYDVFTVTGVEGMVLSVRHHGTGPPSPFAAGTPVVSVDAASFALDLATRTLRVYDGDSTDMPILDDVVGVGVEYYGESLPPVWPKAAPGEANCLYASDGSYHAALMPLLGPPGRLVALTAAVLTDGPWCGTGSTRFDADLLRVRRVRVTVRLQASDAAVRGGDRARFANPGSAVRSGLMVQDVSLEIDVFLRNLRLE